MLGTTVSDSATFNYDDVAAVSESPSITSNAGLDLNETGDGDGDRNGDGVYTQPDTGNVAEANVNTYNKLAPYADKDIPIVSTDNNSDQYCQVTNPILQEKDVDDGNVQVAESQFQLHVQSATLGNNSSFLTLEKQASSSCSGTGSTNSLVDTCPPTTEQYVKVDSLVPSSQFNTDSRNDDMNMNMNQPTTIVVAQGNGGGRASSTIRALTRAATTLVFVLALIAVLWVCVRVVALQRRVYDLEARETAPIDEVTVRTIVVSHANATEQKLGSVVAAAGERWRAAYAEHAAVVDKRLEQLAKAAVEKEVEHAKLEKRAAMVDQKIENIDKSAALNPGKWLTELDKRALESDLKLDKAIAGVADAARKSNSGLDAKYAEHMALLERKLDLLRETGEETMKQLQAQAALSSTAFEQANQKIATFRTEWLHVLETNSVTPSSVSASASFSAAVVSVDDMGQGLPPQPSPTLHSLLPSACESETDAATTLKIAKAKRDAVRLKIASLHAQSSASKRLAHGMKVARAEQDTEEHHHMDEHMSDPTQPSVSQISETASVVDHVHVLSKRSSRKKVSSIVL